jgi:hypothetical protein
MAEKKPIPPSLAAGFSPRAARDQGVTRRQLRGEQFMRLAYGKYALRDNVTDQLSAIRALLATLPADTIVSHGSALRILRRPLPRELDSDKSLHITVPRGTTYPKVSNVTAHRQSIEPGDRRLVDGLPITSPERTFLDVARHVPPESLVVVGDSLLVAELTTAEDLDRSVQAAYRRPGARLARATVPLLDKGAQSPPESVLRFRIVMAGLPAPQTQCPVCDASGNVLAHVDLGWPRWRVAVEYEGRQHAEDGQFGYDVHRYTKLAAEDWLVLRASRADLAGGSQRFLALLRRTLISRGASLVEVA